MGRLCLDLQVTCAVDRRKRIDEPGQGLAFEPVLQRQFDRAVLDAPGQGITRAAKLEAGPHKRQAADLERTETRQRLLQRNGCPFCGIVPERQPGMVEHLVWNGASRQRTGDAQMDRFLAQLHPKGEVPPGPLKVGSDGPIDRPPPLWRLPPRQLPPPRDRWRTAPTGTAEIPWGVVGPMADPKRRRSENVPGDFFVDETCIDCDTCRWMAPDIYTRVGGRSAVHRQPETPEGRLAAAMALVACPTASIGAAPKTPEVQAAATAFPDPVTETVFHCGYHSESSFGAASWFIRRPDGNVLVDSPRYAKPLAKRIEAMGGIRWLFLTHRDDVADHERFADEFGCERVLHRDDVTAGTRDVEIQPQGEEAFHLAPDLKVIPVPGHTKGHMVLLYDDEVLFTGDHMAWSDRLCHLYAFRGATWYSWDHLVRSMKRLQDERFTRVLPGHGRPHQASAEEMHESLQRCINWMEQ